MCCGLIRDAIRRIDVENHSVKVEKWFNLNGDYIFLQNNGFGEVFDEIKSNPAVYKFVDLHVPDLHTTVC